jgi:hypothetical protein
LRRGDDCLVNAAARAAGCVNNNLQGIMQSPVVREQIFQTIRCL